MLENTFIVAFAGRKRMGKSTAARKIATLFEAATGELPWRRSFADALRVEVAEKYNLPLFCLRDDDRKNEVYANPGVNGRTIRQLLQDHGSERRAEHPNYWIDLLEKSVAPSKLPRVLIIDDMRHENELAWVRRHPNLTIWIGPREPSADDPHVTEQLVLDCDVNLPQHPNQLQLIARAVLAGYDRLDHAPR